MRRRDRSATTQLDTTCRLRAARIGLAVALIAGMLAGPAEAVRRRAFATSVTGTGDLASWPDAAGQAGLAAGDAICRARAAAAGLPNANAYHAWLSSPTTDAFCHVQGLSGQGGPGCTGGAPQPAGPWFLVNGITPWTEDLGLLTQPAGARIYRAVLRDELGNDILTTNASWLWTGTGFFGAASPSHCDNWTDGTSASFGTYGSALGSTYFWTSVGAGFCNVPKRLLCLEPGASELAPPHWVSAGAIVFVTSKVGAGDLSAWPEAGGQAGLAAGDAICRTLAASAHLPSPQSFVAWLSDDLTDVAERLTSDGPFRRIDGLTVASSKADLLDGATNVSLNQNEDGGYGGALSAFVWSGTSPAGITTHEHCSNWTDGTNAGTGGVGVLSFERVTAWTNYMAQSCVTQRALYCFSNVVTLFWDGFELTGDTSRWSATVP